MKANARPFTGQQEKLLEKCISGLDGQLPLGPERCRSAVRRAWEGSSLELRALLSRFLWLVSPSQPGTEGIRLFDKHPDLGEDELARAIVHPKEVVLDIIRGVTGLDAAYLCAVYEAIASRGNPG